MKSFPKPQDTLAGIHKFWFIPVDNVAAMGDVILGELQSITLTSNAEWFDIYGVFNTKGFIENKKEDKKGIRFENSLQAFYPGYSQDVIQQFEEMKLQRFLIAYADYNDNYMIVGTIDNPLNFEYDLNTGKSGQDLQGLNIKFYGNSKTRILSSTGVILKIIPVVFDDWFLPSDLELNYMWTNLHSGSDQYLQNYSPIGGFSSDYYWSSSENDSITSKSIIFFNSSHQNELKSNEYRVRACRSFTADQGTYQLRDIGPAGGLIFFVDGTTYYEAAPSDLESSVWSVYIDRPVVGGTGTSIGTGLQNTLNIINQNGDQVYAAKLCYDLIIEN
jgi:hypothetical protein